MSAAAAYLIKCAVLYNPARPNLNYRLGKQEARRLGTKLYSVRDLYRHAMPPRSDPEFDDAHRFFLNNRDVVYSGSRPELNAIILRKEPENRRVPGAMGEVLSHELDEVRYSRDPKTKGAIGDPLMSKSKRNLAAVYAKARKRSTSSQAPAGELDTYMSYNWRSGNLSPLLHNKVWHANPRVLLDEHYRIQSGQVSPEMAATALQARKQTGEADFLKSLGVDYGITPLQPGGRAYNNVLKKLEKYRERLPAAVTKRLPDHKRYYNISPAITAASKQRTKLDWLKRTAAEAGYPLDRKQLEAYMAHYNSVPADVHVTDWHEGLPVAGRETDVDELLKRLIAR